ncbi:MAG: dipeptide/oligopeptide/nickel ABC transporter ATP-binding protein [Puniceicoccales bacterium]|jgi:ABC-type dipeptide/oligopeptide/nickel transport system ATPase subunit|nr:dipeptide/oligopeptide/nickel ABC transporter ATP-binding protein [Puniceicoccales bacterium]
MGANNRQTSCLISVRNLRACYSVNATTENPILNDVSFDLFAGECLGLIGESGSGKSTIANILVGADIPHTGVVQYALAANANRREFCRWIQLITQSPHTALDPTWTVFKTLKEPLQICRKIPRAELHLSVENLLKSVHLPCDIMTRKPAELSGGQKQRVAIARALAVYPSILICDEIISALDPCIRREILELLRALQDTNGLTLLFISHDLPAVKFLSDRIIVLEDRRAKIFRGECKRLARS